MLHFDLQKTLGSGNSARTLALAAELNPGEVLALSGPSGIGKTTLLRCLAGLDRPDHGHIRFADQVWFDAASRQQLATARRRIGFVFQDYALFPHLTVRQQLRYAQRHADANAIDRWLDLLELTALAERRPGQLSGGQRQRLALARAFVGEPQLLLLDEPLSALDADLRQDIQQRLATALAAQPTTTILVSHDAGEIIRLAQRMIQLSPDSAPRIGTPTELLLGNLTPGRCTVHATVLALLTGDVMTTAVLGIGHDRITTLVSQTEAAQLAVGQPVRVELNGTSAIVVPIASTAGQPGVTASV